ncbi:MAG: site-2 protease family protein [Candidatus Bathyarchaeota archaeon]
MIFADQITTAILVFLIFWILIYIVGKSLKLEKHGFEIKPLVLICRTKKVNSFIDWATQRLSTSVPVLTDISIVMGIGMMIFGAYKLSFNLYFFFSAPVQASPIFPAIPFLTIRESLPFFLMSIVILIVMHELAHGIAARYENIPIKSAGILLLAIIPGGFVEPDEESFKKAERRKKLRILAAGSSANLFFGIIVAVIMLSFFQPSGVLITNVVEDSPAAKVGIQSGDIIKAVDGISTPNLNTFRELMTNVKVGTTLAIELESTDGLLTTVTLTTIADSDNPNRAIIGVYPTDNVAITPLYQALFWMQLWSINLAIVNMFPIYPLDGDGLLYNIVEKYAKNYSKHIRIAATAGFLALLGLNMVFTYTIFGFISI